MVCILCMFLYMRVFVYIYVLVCMYIIGSNKSLSLSLLSLSLSLLPSLSSNYPPNTPEPFQVEGFRFFGFGRLVRSS